MKPADTIRAIDYVRAVATGDEETRLRLEGHAWPNQAIRYVLVAWFEVLVASEGILRSNSATTQTGEDRESVVGGVLARALGEWARLGGEEAPEAIAHVIHDYLLATVDGIRGDVEPLLEMMRAGTSVT